MEGVRSPLVVPHPARLATPTERSKGIGPSHEDHQESRKEENSQAASKECAKGGTSCSRPRIDLRGRICRQGLHTSLASVTARRDGEGEGEEEWRETGGAEWVGARGDTTPAGGGS